MEKRLQYVAPERVCDDYLIMPIRAQRDNDSPFGAHVLIIRL